MRPLNKVLAVMPTYNERDNILKVIERVLASDARVELLVIDDASPDGTGDIVARLMNGNGRLHLMRRAGKLGLGTAYVAGFRYALQHDYDAVVQIDADLSHNPKDIPRLITYAERGAHLVVGSRYISGVNVVNWPLQRLLISYFASVYTRLVTAMPLRDATAGFNLIRREVLQAVDLDRIKTNGYGFQIEFKFYTWKKGFRIVECPIVFIERAEGQSKMDRKIMIEAAVLVWKLRLMSIFGGVH
ncbi:glycosyltransferase [bacterium]|nr:glycosyltransferase [bacterium]